MNALRSVVERFESLGSQIDERIQSEEYLALVRRAFRTWDRSDTQEKRRYVGNLVSNAAGTRLCSDDVVRLFIDWLDLYHEAHFAVIREIYANPGSSRFLIWDAIHGALPREDSAEADLFKLLVRDLSTGGVIRQARDTNQYGQFLRRNNSYGTGMPAERPLASRIMPTAGYGDSSGPRRRACRRSERLVGTRSPWASAIPAWSSGTGSRPSAVPAIVRSAGPPLMVWRILEHLAATTRLHRR